MKLLLLLLLLYERLLPACLFWFSSPSLYTHSVRLFVIERRKRERVGEQKKCHHWRAATTFEAGKILINNDHWQSTFDCVDAWATVAEVQGTKG